VIYVNEKNSSIVFEICERIFEIKQGDQSVPDELKMHQPAITDAATLRRYR